MDMSPRAVIDIGNIDISIKISCDIDIDTEIVDMIFWNLVLLLFRTCPVLQ